MNQAQITRLKNKQHKLQEKLKAEVKARADIVRDKLGYYANLIDLDDEAKTLEFLAFTQYEMETQAKNLRSDTYRYIMQARQIKERLQNADQK